MVNTAKSTIMFAAGNIPMQHRGVPQHYSKQQLSKMLLLLLLNATDDLLMRWQLRYWIRMSLPWLILYHGDGLFEIAHC